MANSFPVPFVAADLADPSQAGIGEIIDSDPQVVRARTQTLNYLHATGITGVVVSQTWADQLLAWNTATWQVGVCTWRVPVLSTAHANISVEIRALGTNNGGSVRFNIGASTVTIAVPGGVAVSFYAAGAAIVSGGGVYDDVSLDI